MWKPEIVLARFIEACDVEHRMWVKGGPTAGNAWPSYCYEQADIDGWDKKAEEDHLERWQNRKVTKSPELHRWEECFFEWTPLIAEDRRFLVWRFAQCQANGGSFSEWCRKKGIVRQTAYNRVAVILEMLAEQFDKEARRLREPDARFYRQPKRSASIHVASSRVDVAARYGATHPKAYRAEPSTDHLTSPDAIAAFEQHMADVNERRRKARLRKALRGVPGEQEAA